MKRVSRFISLLYEIVVVIVKVLLIPFFLIYLSYLFSTLIESNPVFQLLWFAMISSLVLFLYFFFVE